MGRPTNEERMAREALALCGFQRCSGCEDVKSLNEFGFSNANRRTKCKPCTNTQMRGYAQATKARDPEGYLTCMREANRRWRANESPEKRKTRERADNLRRQYGVSPEWVDTKLAGQGGVCAICGNGATSGKNWHVDHSHKTMLLRGVLCATCNVGLGAFGDDPERLRVAAAYIEHHQDVAVRAVNARLEATGWSR